MSTNISFQKVGADDPFAEMGDWQPDFQLPAVGCALDITFGGGEDKRRLRGRVADIRHDILLHPLGGWPVQAITIYVEEA